MSNKKLLLVIVDRFTKLLDTVSFRSITDFNIAMAFKAYWELVYGVQKSVLTDNSKKFNDKLLLEKHKILGTKERLTTTYEPELNAYKEHLNRTILAYIRRYTADHPNDRDKFSDTLTYAYYTQKHT